MTGTALFRDFVHKFVLTDMTDLVSGMAVFAVGKLLLAFRIFNVVNTLYIFLINPLMAGRTGGGDVPEIDR